MTDLATYLSTLALDPEKLGEFLVRPEASVEASGLNRHDRDALLSRTPARITARLADAPVRSAEPEPPLIGPIHEPKEPEPELVAPIAHPKEPEPELVAPIAHPKEPGKQPGTSTRRG